MHNLKKYEKDFDKNKSNKDKTNDAKSKCKILCKKFGYKLLFWNGSVNYSTFYCPVCKTKFKAVYDRLRKNHPGCNVCRNTKIASEICSKLGYSFKVIKPERITKETKFKITCTNCGFVFRKMVSSCRIKNLICPCKNKNNIKADNAERIRKSFCKRHGIKIVDSFINESNLFIWKFKCGHLVKRSWDNLKQGHIKCPECDSSSSVESKIRVWLNNKTRYFWFSERPVWLKNKKTNKSLELDIYSDRLGIAIEYNGSMHYKVCGGFFNEQELFIRKRLDKMKVTTCKKKGINLIVINGMNFSSFKSIKSYLISILPSNIWNETDAQFKEIRKGF